MSPRPRFNNISEEKRIRILTVAANEFATHGFEQASLNQIIELSKISKGAMYYYFDGKLDLYATVAAHFGFSLFTKQPNWDDFQDSETFWKAVREIFLESFQKAITDPLIFSFFRSYIKLPPKIRTEPWLVSLEKIVQESVTKVISSGQKYGAIRVDLPIALLMNLIFGIDEILDTWVMETTDPSSFELEKILLLYLDTAKRILCPADSLAIYLKTVCEASNAKS